MELKNTISYADLCKNYDMILNNRIMEATDYDSWTLVNGTDRTFYDADWSEIEEDEYYDRECNGEDVHEEFDAVYQQYVVSENFVEFCQKRCPDVTIWYNDELDIYLVDIGFYGIGWSYVSTAYKCVFDMDAPGYYRFATEEEIAANEK